MRSHKSRCHRMFCPEVAEFLHRWGIVFRPVGASKVEVSQTHVGSKAAFSREPSKVLDSSTSEGQWYVSVFTNCAWRKLYFH